MKGLSCNRTKKEVKNGETVISTTTYGYNAGNQLTSINSQPLTYDSNGNLTDDGTKLYTWDAAGRLIEVRNKADNSLIAQYEYDYLDRRIKSTANGVVTNYHYDGGSINVLYETDGNNSLTKLYTYSADGMLISMTKVDGANKTTYYYHYNARGDVVKLTAQDGTEVASYTYDAWGNILSSSGTMAGENPYRYAGYRYDSDINLYYLMARYYKPETGRFLSKDPIPDAVNDYIYSGNNPVNYVDPTGEKADPYNGRMSTGGGGKSVGFKPNISRNFRHNLEQLIGKVTNRMVNAEAHHVLPQKFNQYFKNAGINIHDPKFGTWVEKASHRKWSYEYNKAWANFFASKKNPTADEILSFAKKLAQKYGFKINF